MSGPLHVDEILTRRAADLARLDLSDTEVRVFTSQLDQILNYVQQLGEVDLCPGGVEVEPLMQPVEPSTELREDRVVPTALDIEGKPKVLGSAPEIVDGGYKVPQIL